MTGRQQVFNKLQTSGYNGKSAL